MSPDFHYVMLQQNGSCRWLEVTCKMLLIVLIEMTTSVKHTADGSSTHPLGTCS